MTHRLIARGAGVALGCLAIGACVDSTAPAVTPFAAGELRAVVSALDTAGGSDPGPYTAASALLFARVAGRLNLDSIATTPPITGTMTGSYRAIAVLVNLQFSSSGSPTSTKQSLLALIGWNGYNAATGTVDNAFVVALNAPQLQPTSGFGLTTPFDGSSGFATPSNRASAARFYADSGRFTAARWVTGTATFCGIPGGTFGDLCSFAQGTLDGSFNIFGSNPAHSSSVVVPTVNLSGLPLVVLNWSVTQ